eukprot:CAMPEP_0117653134 /NCGR_PEP_ID=MMETSP0804-20121206/3024_1 /TAXON_ID=1074897 /ORGANISM="Tetraselmis astigmatica, Strain CCMP880" /LENGTH=552 /DNA_ID=CAMNT_0005459279 /DNA_START=56 /DNA_END=1714 /DNA_ORIENTATION=-
MASTARGTVVGNKPSGFGFSSCSPPRGRCNVSRAVTAGRATGSFKATDAVVEVNREKGSRGTVVIAGGGLAGLSAAKALVDRGYTPVVLEARDVLGGKVAAWKDKDGDWVETGLHIIFGAYPNMLQLVADLGIQDRLQWKKHSMVFAMPNLPGTFSRFDFPDLPGPFNALVAILGNSDMLTWPQKIRFGIALLPALLGGDKYIAEADNITISEWLRKTGAPPEVEQEIFVAMSKALAFIDPERLSATVVLTALNRFLRETNGSKNAFLDGNFPERLCQPLQEYIEKRGGKVLLNKPLDKILLDASGDVLGFLIRGIDGGDSEVWKADKYMSAMPVHALRLRLPEQWREMAFFSNAFDNLISVPVINVQLWFDRKLPADNSLIFSRSKLLSVYADMSTTCRECYDNDRSMLEFVFAPATVCTGAERDWIAESDEAIVGAVMEELERLFPDNFGSKAASPAHLCKSSVVKTPQSIYQMGAGMQRHRPTQATPVTNFFLAGDYTLQRYLASMEGAILSGKQAAEAIEARDERRSPAEVTVTPGAIPAVIDVKRLS